MKTNKEHHAVSQNESKAIGYMCLSAFLGAVIAATIKSLSAAMSPLIAFWLSRFFPMLGLIPMALKGQLKHLKTAHFAKHLLLNVFYVSSILFYFYSLGTISLVDANLLFNSGPLYAPAIAFLFLKEYFPKVLWWYVLMSFAGVVCVLQPTGSLFQPVSLLAALSGILMSGAQVMSRRMARHEPHHKIVFYMIVLAPFLGTIPMLADPKLIFDFNFDLNLKWVVLAKLVLAGISTWGYQIYRTQSAAHGRVAVVLPFSYLAVVFAGFFDWFFWGSLPNYLTLVGLVLIFLGSIFILKHSRRTNPPS